MQRLFILLMIVLLPLRGWAGDVMSVRMATGGSVFLMADAMPPDCPMHAQAGQASAAADVSGEQPFGGMKNCASCGLCIPLAELTAARLELVTFATHVQPLMGNSDFMSASVAPAVKPPIF